MPDPIRDLARACAERGLDLRSARMVFDALYLADTNVMTGRNRAAMARRAGLERCHLYTLDQAPARELGQPWPADPTPRPTRTESDSRMTGLS